MNAPIVEFVKNYVEKKPVRAHMPGHKGEALLGFENYDITEIKGADELYDADGIISESEKNAASLFGSKATFYSCEGSTQCIKAMLLLALQNRKKSEKRPVIIAARNAHKAFVYACAQLDVDVEFLCGEGEFSLCSCRVSQEELKAAIEKYEPFAVYVTSPNYLGECLDIQGLSAVAHSFGVPLLVDNAHGAYLKFLPKSLHPLDCGADMCCDSAHKTLPALTGAAYLHISKNSRLSNEYALSAKKALEIFGSTSPSYLILQSLDLCNVYLASDFPNELAVCKKNIDALKEDIRKNGYDVLPSDPLRVTIASTGLDVSERLRSDGIEPEYVDPDRTVLMLTPQNSLSDFEKIKNALGKTEKSLPLEKLVMHHHERKMTVREAVFSKSESVGIKEAVGRICAAPTVSCPPAVPIVVSGEVINENDVPIFEHYNVCEVSVVKQTHDE